MIIEKAIVARISGTVSGRVYPVVAPVTPQLPYVDYQRISTADDHSHDGPGLTTARFQFSVWGSTYAEMIETAELVDLRLDGWTDPGIASLAAGGWDDVDEQTKRFRKFLDYLISYVKGGDDS